MENFRLKVFRVVARHLNFTRAAEELLLTQPAVTQQIKALEDEYGLPLFNRSGGRISLTPAGSTLLPFAEQLKTLSDQAFEAVVSTAGSVAGSLSLGASQTVGQYLLPKLIAAFLRDNPRVSITAISGNTDEMLTALADRRIQLALVEGPTLRKDLHTEPFMNDRMILAVPASHEWANQQISLEDLRSAPLLIREFGSGSRRIVEQALAAHDLTHKDLNIAMELDSTEGLLTAVEAGLGVAFVSHWAVRNHVALGTLAVTRVRGLKLLRQFLLAYNAGPAPQGIASAFHRFILCHSL